LGDVVTAVIESRKRALLTISIPTVFWNAVSPAPEARGHRAAQARATSGRRRLVDPTTCERDYSMYERTFMDTIQVYKQSSGSMFPTWSEVLEVLGSLGYQKGPVPRVTR
jgi:hypothetical protein